MQRHVIAEAAAHLDAGRHLLGRRATTGNPPPLHDLNAEAASCEVCGADQAVVSGADDDDIRIRHDSPSLDQLFPRANRFDTTCTGWRVRFRTGRIRERTTSSSSDTRTNTAGIDPEM